MNKKLFGIKLSTYLVAVVCLLVSVLIWMFVKYDIDAKEQAEASLHVIRSLIGI